MLCQATVSREVQKYGVSFMSSDTLRRIKRAVLAGNYAFSEKALLEMEADGLTELDIAESILNAVAIYKTLRSQSPCGRNAPSTCISFKAPISMA